MALRREKIAVQCHASFLLLYYFLLLIFFAVIEKHLLYFLWVIYVFIVFLFAIYMYILQNIYGRTATEIFTDIIFFFSTSSIFLLLFVIYIFSYRQQAKRYSFSLAFLSTFFIGYACRIPLLLCRVRLRF